MKVQIVASILVATFLLSVSGFVPSTAIIRSLQSSSSSSASSAVNALLASSNNNDADDTGDNNDDHFQNWNVPPKSSSGGRRDFMAQTLAVAASTTTALSTGLGVWAPSPAHAVRGPDKVNASLKAYGLPPISKVPKGLVPLLEVYGRGANRFPLLVLMNHPLTWVVTLPSNDVNGEDGTIQAGEYAKGDTATFFVYSDEGHVNNLGTADKSLFERALIKAISQKGANMYQNFKVTKIVPQTGPEYGGKDYVLCDFRYELLTGAGFEVDRRGVAAVTSEGPAVEVLWAASTRERYKKTEDTLRDITSSFRVYADGLNFSNEIIKGDELLA